MTWTVLIFGVLILTSIAGLLFAMPSIVHPTVPLGVSVPHDRVGDPVIRTAERRFRVAIVGCWVFAIVVMALLTGRTALALTVPILLLVVLGAVAYLVARAAISRAKRDGHWYAGVPVRLSADVTAHASPRPPIWWVIVSGILLIGTAVVGILVYRSLPGNVPVHWNAAGQINRYAAKSVWTVFGPVFIAAGVVALLFALSHMGRLTTGRTVASDSLEQAAHRANVQRHLLVSMLGQLGLLITLLLCALTLSGWLAPHSGVLFGVLPVVLIVLVAGLLALFVLRYSRSMARTRLAAPTTGTPHPSDARDAPDDDRYWKGGLFYVNRDDPAVFVPKRFGVGWTINLGSAGGFAVGVLIVLIIVASITIGIVAPSQH